MLKKLFYSSREDRNHISKIGVVTNLFLCLFGSLNAQVSKKITNLFGNSKDVGTSRLRIVSLLTMLLLSPFAKSQLVTEDFNYTASSGLVVTNGYTANSGTGTSNLTTAASGTGLSYPGSPRSNVGLSLPMVTTGEDAYKSFTSQTTGAVYASALINLSAAQATGDYFFCIMTGTTYNVRLFAKSSGTGYVLGINKAGGTTLYDATVRSFNTTYIVVLKYEFITGTLNDPVSLYVNPTLGGTEPSPLLTSTGTPTADAASISSYGFRQGAAGSAPTLVIDGIMVGTTWAQVTPLAAASPTISQPTAITGLNYTGSGPSTWTSYTFTGSNLSPSSGNITVAGTTNFEVSSDGVTAAAGNSYTIAYTGGALSSTTTYVRLKSGLSAATYGPITGVTLSGGGVTTINVSTSGTVTAPLLTPSVASITGLNYTGTGPSSPQSFTFSGTNLTGTGNITATAPTNFEVSTDNISFFASVTYPYTPGTLSAQTVYVRLKTSLSVATYGPLNVTITGGGATTANVSVTGTVSASSVISQPAAITGLNYTFGSGPSSWTPFTFTGTSLSPAAGNITVTGTTNFEVSSDGVTSAVGNTYNVPYTGSTLSSTTVYVRLKSGLAIATYGPISGVTLSGGGATTINVSTTGVVSVNPYLVIPTINSPVLSNFNSIGSTGTATLSPGFKTGTDWSVGGTSTTLAYGTSGTGAVTGTSGGGIINWADGITGSSTDRAIGFLTTGSFTTPTSIVLAIQNNTGATATELYVTFDIEKYRTGIRAWDVTFFHGNTNTPTTSATAGDQNYPADGANAAVNPPTSISKSVSLSGLSIPAGGIYYLKWTSTGLGGTTNAQGLGIDNIAITLSNAISPAVTVTPTSLTGFTYTLGSGPSTPQTFTVSGTNLTNNVIITPSTNYEVSLTSGSGYVTSPSTLSVTQSGGTLTGQPVTIYTRLKAGLSTGTYNGEVINITSTGSIPKTISASGVVAAAIVSVSASTSTASEQAGTVVTVTATTNNPVVTDQTVDITVSGTGITSTDYSITDGDAAVGIQIKILAGNTTGTTTFTILDDNLLESSESVTLTISNPTSGMGLGSPTTVNITIADNDDAVLLTTLNSPSATTNFNEIVTTGTSTDLSKGSYFLETGTGQNSTYSANDGSSSSGDTYSYGTGTNTDRALGSGITASMTDVKIGFKIKNNTGSSFNAIIIEYYGEQWRRGTTGSTGSQFRDKLKFEYSTSATDLSTGTWGSSSILNFNSPDFGSVSNDAARNGNSASYRTLIKDTIFIPSGVSAGSNVWVRWIHSTTGTSGSRDGLGIDDVIFTPINFSPTIFYTDATGDLDQLSTWYTNTDGTGANPISFSGSNQIFVVQNRSTATIGSNWTISGSNSGVRIRDGVTVTIPDAYSFVGKIDSLEGTSTLYLNNAYTPILNGIEPNTTVVYGSNSNQDIAVPTSSSTQYGNLTLSGSGTKRYIGGFRVEGEYLFNSASVDATPTFSVVFFKKNLTISGTITYSSNYTSYVNLQAYGSNAQQLIGNGNEIKAGRLLMNVANTGGILITSGTDLKTGSLSLDVNTDLNLSDDLKLNNNSGSSSFTDNGNTITVGGDFECAGSSSNYSFTGTEILNGSTGTVNIRQDGSTGSGSSVKASLNNLVIQTSGTTISQIQPTTGNANIIIKGNLTISGTSTGKFTPNGNTIKIAGDFSDTRTSDMILPGTSTFEFNGTSSQNFSTSYIGGESFYNVLISNTTGLTLTTGNMRITGTGNLNCSLGGITTGSNKVILSNLSTITETSANNVLGNVESTRVLTNTLNQFGGMGFEITALGSSPGSTTVLRNTGNSTDIGCSSTSLLRKFTVTPTTNSGLNAIVTYSYLNSDLNSIAESSLALYSGTAPWSSISTSVDISNNSITATGLNSLSTYVSAYSSLPSLNTNSTTIDVAHPSRMLNVLSPDVNTNYVWSPISDLYTDADLTIPYVSGASATTVYAAPFSSITYNVTATNTIIACTTSPVSIVVNVDPAITNDICASNSPAGLVPVTSTPTFVLRSLTGATASPGAACIAINKDIWFSAVVPSNGEIHVTTQEHNNPTASLNITSALVQIFTATTCSTGLSQVACNAGGAAANMAYASATGLTPGTTVYIRLARTTANNSPVAQFIRMAVTKGLIWTGTTNSDFTNPGNYLGGDATSLTGPSTSSTVIIPAVSSNTYPIVTGTQTCHGLEFVSTYSNQNPNITINPGAELRLQASSTYKSFIDRSGFASSPKIQGTGTLRFNEGGVNSGEVLCPVRFYGVVAVRSGVNVISNGNMRFENNSVLLCGGVATSVPTKNYSGTVSGNIVYVRTGTVYAGYNYWSSPIVSANTDLLLSNYGNNIYEYNNQNPGSVTNTLLGWSAITSGTTSIPGSGVTMTPGKGYIQTFAGNGSVTFTGAPNQTSVSIPTTINGTNNFNLLGNPYPAALSYDAFKASNPSLGSVYLWSNVGATLPYNVSSYVVMSSLGLAGNNVSGFTAKEIGPTQGFLTNVSSAGNINFSPNHVVPNYPGNTTQFLESNPLSVIRLRLTNPNQLNYDILVGFGDEGTEGVDFGYDSPRMPSSEDLELYSLIGEQQYTTQLLPSLTNTRIVDLGAVMSATGTHTFDLTGFDNFDSSVRVYLEDVLTGEFHNMNVSSSYSFTNDPSFTNTRFRLHFMAPITVSVTGTCLEQNNGKMIINNPNDQNPITATLRNEQGVVVGSSSPFVGDHVFQNLTSGSYGVDLSLNQNDVVTQYVNIDGGGILSTATFVSSSTEVSIADAIIEFSAQAQGASEFTWDFGDGVILSGTATPVHAYTQPGIYTVTLTASNGSCESTVSSIIIVTNNVTGITDVAGTNGFSIYPNPANDQLNIVKLNNDKVLFEMNDVSGKCVLRSQLNSKLNNINISHLDSGVYSGSMIQNGTRKTIRIVIVH